VWLLWHAPQQQIVNEHVQGSLHCWQNICLLHAVPPGFCWWNTDNLLHYRHQNIKQHHVARLSPFLLHLLVQVWGCFWKVLPCQAPYWHCSQVWCTASQFTGAQ
jgi:hypothetical protein